MTIAIAGGGIGGLVAALSVHAAGMRDIVILKASPGPENVAAGIGLAPYAVRELSELGLSTKLAAASVETTALARYDECGKLISTEPLGFGAGYLWPQYSTGRIALQRLLLEAVQRRLGPDSIRAGCSISELRFNPDGVDVRFLNSEGKAEEISASVLLGADGIRSAVRQAMFPRCPKAAWIGSTMWQGATWARPFLDGTTMVSVGNETQRVVVYPAVRSSEGGATLLNWFLIRYDYGRPPRQGGWKKPVAPTRPASFVEQWKFDWLDIGGLIAAATAAYEYPVMEVHRLPSSTRGRATLMGAAAHGVRVLSSGASRAVIDARVLAHELAISPDPSTALVSYEYKGRLAIEDAACEWPTYKKLEASSTSSTYPLEDNVGPHLEALGKVRLPD